MRLQESQIIEFKEAWRDEYLKTVCAFANTDGGTFYIGVDDRGEVVGVDNVKKLMEDLPNKVMNAFVVTVDIQLKEENRKQYIQMAVSKSNTALSYHGKFYARSGSTTQELKGGELQRLLLKTNNLSWDEVPVSNADFDDIDMRIVREFIKQATEYNRLPSGIDSDNIKHLFHNLKLTNKNDELTRAAVLLFGKNPTRFFSSAIFKIGRFKGEDPTDLIVSDFVEGNLFQMPSKVMDLLKSKYLLSPISYKGLQRVETLEIPEKAMREAVLNAIIHRDYTSASSIELRVFDQFITLWNYGKLEDLSIADLRVTHNSNPRNSLIAQIFYRAGYIESWGRGTLTIINEIINIGLPEPVFNEYLSGVQLLFKRNPYEKDKPSATDNYLNERQQKAVAYAKENGALTNKIYQGLNNISKPTATRDLTELVKLGILEKIGTSGESVRYILVGS